MIKPKKVMDTEHFMTRDQVAVELGLTRKTIQKIEERAIFKMRTYCRRRNISAEHLRN